MPRDYKDINKQAKKANRSTGSFISNLFSFITGLSIGLFIAAYTFMQPDWSKRFPALAFLNNDKIMQMDPGQSVAKEKPKDTTNVPLPKFEFYDILRNRKLNISETIASEQDARDSTTDTANVYLLQVGSFADYQTADQLKAQLAFLGITSDITRVVINGRDSVHRVRIGPFEDPEKLRETRQRLEENSLEYTLLKLELDETQE